MIPQILSDFLKQSKWSYQDEAKQFLAKYSSDDQMLLISCIYIGRDYLNILKNLHESPEELDCKKRQILSRDFLINNIEDKDYAKIIYEKQGNAKSLYIPELIKVAEKNNIDLDLPKYQD